MKRVAVAGFMLALLTSGCCTVLHYDRVSRASSGGEKGDFDWGCAVVGNILLGGVVGIVVDLLDGAAWTDKREDVSTSTRPEAVPAAAGLVAVCLIDGTTIMLDTAPNPEGPNRAFSLVVPQEHIARYEWLGGE